MSRYQVWLDGLALQDVDPAIFITDVQEQSPTNQFSTAARASGDGLHVTQRSRSSLSVSIRFAIREYQPAKRKAIMQKVRAWAQQGKCLTISDRPGQQLLVEADSLPVVESALKWTADCEVSFIACTCPYWEESDPIQTDTFTLTPPGDAETCPMDVRWTCPKDMEDATFAIATPLSSIVFSGLTIENGQELVLTHSSGYLTATIAGNDILACRTPVSSDDLLLHCGQSNAVSITVDGVQVTGCTISARGRWI